MNSPATLIRPAWGVRPLLRARDSAPEGLSMVAGSLPPGCSGISPPLVGALDQVTDAIGLFGVLIGTSSLKYHSFTHSEGFV